MSSSKMLLYLVPIVLAAVVGILCRYPSPSQTVQDVRTAFDNFQRQQPQVFQMTPRIGAPTTFGIMSFNIRHDIPESKPDNEWAARVGRVAKVIEEYAPSSVGLQEPFGVQAEQLLSALPPHWKAVGDHHDSPHPLSHPSRKWDMKAGILYDSHKLELLHWHHQWLSKTPGVPHSSNWGSLGARHLTIAHFRRGLNLEQDILHFNTHFDVRSEQARREQARMVKAYVEEYTALYPSALVFVTGDFNAAVGQTPYKILTTPNAEKQEGMELLDTWTSCEQASFSSPSDCTVVDSSPSMSYHGWLGLWTDSYLARLGAKAAFTLHGMGLNLPHFFPTDVAGVTRAVTQFSKSGWKYPISEAIPPSSERMHVDWILYAEKSKDAKQRVRPRFVSLVDVKHDAFSSDHYPVLALFDIAKPWQGVLPQ
jgi:endonuclease/exonuclease/phosphatase family metal-dependent hydrolase